MMPDPSVTLTPRDHTLVITFAALNYTSPAANQYAYRLEGHDPVWIDAGAERVARFVNLPPGRYTFRVRAANNDGVWNEDGAALALTVSPSFWQTIWFRLLLGVLVAGALAGGYRLRVKRLLEVERLRLRIAGDLHDDIGSKLGSIALISEMVAGHEGLDERDVARLQEVARVSRRMAGDLRDIVWLVSPGYDTVGDLAAKLEHVAASILSGVSVSVETPGESAGVQLPMETRRQVFLAYREVLHNVARHARASRVDVRLDQDAGAIVLEVRDDGVGWDQRERTLGHGLRSLRERTQQVGGSVEILSAQGEGTTVRLRVPAA